MDPLVDHASGTCPTSSGSYGNGSCCYKWNPAANSWEFVSGAPASGFRCYMIDEIQDDSEGGFVIDPLHDADWILSLIHI